MKKILLLLLLTYFSLAPLVMAYEIVVVKGSRSRLSERLQVLFAQELTRLVPADQGVTAIQPHQVREIVLSGSDRPGLADQLAQSRPDLLLAIGSRALQAALTVPELPIVHLLVADPAGMIGGRAAVSGVGLAVPPRVQLAALRRALPGVRRVGLVYDPERSSGLVEQLVAAAPDLHFITRSTARSSEVPELIQSLQGKVDLLWMLPDLTVSNRKTMESYLLFSIKNKIPLLTFSAKLLRRGATLAITFDLEGIALQAATLAVELLSRGEASGHRAVVAPQAQTLVNQRMAEKLGISIVSEEEDRD
ncbi:ABC transporter substrate-binding protein [Desulfogranum mediterraneum]|uniref:ABC transporter substrate-binding protein n=1 Tax=Desulfogranum mediterraneum TaxID=160661 RepID=UPI0003F6EF30|nr:ABC transporter substrate binding protein [Desulfogranum mediterraneum]